MMRFLSVHKITLIILINMFFTGTSFAANCVSITQNGITWTFSASVECGQFVTGDWWVVAPVTIINQSPAWDGTKNGAMLDPAVGGYAHGYQNATCYTTTYSDSLRLAFPTTISTGVKSVISTITRGADTAGCVDNAAVLTIVNSVPTATNFRPQFVAGTKTFYDSATVNYSLIPSYTAPGTAFDLTSYGNMPTLNYGAKTFGDQAWFPRNYYNSSSYPAYSFGKFIPRLSLMMMLNTPNRVSYINKMIQIGIDDYPKAVGNNDAWMASGGYGVSHIWPIIFAGKMLGSDTLLSVPRYTANFPLLYKFSEQGYTYYKSDGTPWFGSDECLNGGLSYPCTAGNCMCRDPAGLLYPEQIPGGGSYRTIVSPLYAGQALAMRMLEPTLGTMTAFNHPSFFDYTDSWVANPLCTGGCSTPISAYQADYYGFGGSGNGFMKYMWNTYRNYKRPFPPKINSPIQ